MRKWVLRAVLAGICTASVTSLSGCTAIETALAPFDKFSRAMSGEPAYEERMERYREAVEWEKEIERREEGTGALPGARF